MLSIFDLTKSFGPQVLFENASLKMSSGERLGLVGRNGYGKSTIFRMILGEAKPDSGTITTPKNYRIGHLAQHLHFSKPTVLEEACLGLLPEEEYDHYKAQTILSGLGFTEEDMAKSPSEFSGGFQIRLNLAKVLVSNPNLLLLDEPTNYLDIISIRWITRFLRAWKNELIIISHDREFLDSVTTHTALIHRQKIKKIEGPTEKLYALIEQEEETYEKTRINQEKQRKHAEAFINRFRAQANRAAMVQSRVKMLDKLPKLQELSNVQDLDFQFHYSPFVAKTMMEVSNLSFSFDSENFLINDLSLTISSKDRVAIIGKNGKGKSTLLNLLAGELKPNNGDVTSHPDTKLGYFGQTNINRLNLKITVEEEITQANTSLGRTQVRGICGIMMFSGELAEKKISNLSGGEKSRVMLGKILAQPSNLLFLDEPTNHLDMESIETLIEAIENFDGASVVVTHSEEILRRVATKLVVFHHGIAEVFNGNYDDFLEKIGWEEEGGKSSKTKTPSSNPKKPEAPLESNKKDRRKQRSDIISERSKALTPLNTEIESLEKEICSLEKIVEETNNDLIKASQEKNTNAFISLSQTLKNTQKQIDEKFGRLEMNSKKLQDQTQKYDALLKELE